MRTLLLSLTFPALLAASDWTQFRGPDVSGVSEKAKPPVTFDGANSIAWKAPLPGSATELPASLAALPGVEGLARTGPEGMAFLFGGAMPALLRTIADLAPNDVRIEEPSLEEIFLRHYTKH